MRRDAVNAVPQLSKRVCEVDSRYLDGDKDSSVRPAPSALHVWIKWIGQRTGPGFGFRKRVFEAVLAVTLRCESQTNIDQQTSRTFTSSQVFVIMTGMIPCRELYGSGRGAQSDYLEIIPVVGASMHIDDVTRRVSFVRASTAGPAGFIVGLVGTLSLLCGSKKDRCQKCGHVHSLTHITLISFINGIFFWR